jgi:hypothetical protein
VAQAKIDAGQDQHDRRIKRGVREEDAGRAIGIVRLSADRSVYRKACNSRPL